MTRENLFLAAAILVSVCLFFILRLYNLKFLPIFVDEAIYVHWAQLGFYDADLRLVSLTDGKQPLFIWLITILTNFIHNPLIAGRIVSIMAGFGTMIGLFLLCIALFKNRWVGIISVLLYVFYPFALVVNRMAIYESLIGMFSIWSLYVALLLIRSSSLGISMILGLVLGGGLLTKSSGFTNIYLLPTVLLLFDFKRRNFQKIIKLVLFFLLAATFAFLCYSVLLLSDDFSSISEKNARFIYHVGELIPYHAFEKWPANILELLHWTVLYLTYPAALIILFSFAKRDYIKEKILLFLWFIVPLIGIALFGRALTPRYLFPMTLTLLPIVVISFRQLYVFFKNKIAYSFIVILGVSFLAFSIYKILADMPNAPIPKEDIRQYVNSFSSGAGFREIVPYLQDKAKEQKIVIASEGNYESFPGTVVEIYFFQNPNVERYKFDALPKKLPKELYNKAKAMPVYIIFNETQSVKNWPLELIMRFRRGSSDLYLSLYKIK